MLNLYIVFFDIFSMKILNISLKQIGLAGVNVKILDCRGLTCPKPVILTKKELEIAENSEIEVLVDNEAARENVSKYAQSQGYTYNVKEEGKVYHITISREKAVVCSPMSFDQGPVIVVGTDKLGNGDDKLGAALMKSYMYALSESEVKPETMLFLNGGVKLTTEGSEVLESLKTLLSHGVEIMSCGTCLDFYDLKEKLAVGSVTNMYTIVEKMNKSSNTIKL
jgi:selenium metabolism protein YedF